CRAVASIRWQHLTFGHIFGLAVQLDIGDGYGTGSILADLAQEEMMASVGVFILEDEGFAPDILILHAALATWPFLHGEAGEQRYLADPVVVVAVISVGDFVGNRIVIGVDDIVLDFGAE